MKKDTSELILSEIIKINTEIVKIHSEIGYLKDDMKRMDERLNEKIDEGFAKIYGEIQRLDYMLADASTYYLSHERRIEALEAA